jgi:predicted aspartyl protease
MSASLSRRGVWRLVPFCDWPGSDHPIIILVLEGVKMPRLVLLVVLVVILARCSDSRTAYVYHGDPSARIVVGPPGKQSVLDGTGRYIGDARELMASQAVIPQPVRPGESFDGSALHGNAIALVKDGGTFKVPVLINGIIPLNFTVDSGAADVTIPADVVLTLTRTGTLNAGDFLGTKTYVLADGSTVPSQTFRIRKLKVGDRIIENVVGSMADVKGGLLLGQSFLSRFSSWSINNSRQILILN